MRTLSTENSLTIVNPVETYFTYYIILYSALYLYK